jgi:hypothetical protein
VRYLTLTDMYLALSDWYLALFDWHLALSACGSYMAGLKWSVRLGPKGVGRKGSNGWGLDVGQPVAEGLKSRQLPVSAGTSPTAKGMCGATGPTERFGGGATTWSCQAIKMSQTCPFPKQTKEEKIPLMAQSSLKLPKVSFGNSRDYVDVMWVVSHKHTTMLLW